ncbi:hypothetical protein Hanom_Chr16g01513511 [Helianthus anomalus]
MSSPPPPWRGNAMANACPVWSRQRCLATAAPTHGLSSDFCTECSVTCKIMAPKCSFVMECLAATASTNINPSGKIMVLDKFSHVHLIAIRIILLWPPSCIRSSCSSTVSWRLNIFRLFHPHNIKRRVLLALLRGLVYLFY